MIWLGLHHYITPTQIIINFFKIQFQLNELITTG